MKLFLGLLLILILSSCKHGTDDNRIIINLNDLEDTIEYSSFVDSVPCLQEDKMSIKSNPRNNFIH